VLTRRGGSLAELLVAFTLAALILASATGSLLRQQRITTGMVASSRDVAQLRAATALLPASLALLAPSADDLVTGEARDTALQLRVPVATGLACDTATAVSFAVATTGLPSAGVASMPRASDTLWWYSTDSARWTAATVSDAATDVAGCGGAAVQPIIRLRTTESPDIPIRAPLRVTRQLRVAVYRSGDGTWQLGQREWSGVTGNFTTPQPAAGPFQRIAPDGLRTGFRYFDAAGAELTVAGGSAFTPRVARIRFTAIAAGNAARPGARDSADIVLHTGATPP
jgi:hypothetical protein